MNEFSIEGSGDRKFSDVVIYSTPCHTVEPRFNEVAGDRPNSFVKSRVRFIEVLFSYRNLVLLGQRIPFVISRFSSNRGSLNQGSPVFYRPSASFPGYNVLVPERDRLGMILGNNFVNLIADLPNPS